MRAQSGTDASCIAVDQCAIQFRNSRRNRERHIGARQRRQAWYWRTVASECESVPEHVRPVPVTHDADPERNDNDRRGADDAERVDPAS